MVCAPFLLESMNEDQLREIQHHLEAVMAVYNQRDGKLSALEVSLKSLVTTLHSQVEMQLHDAERGSTWR
jgi:hypothetical protein